MGCFLMPKGVPNKRYTGEFKQMVVETLRVERRGRGSTGRPRKLPKDVEEDLLAENQRLKAELAYLKKLQALVSEREQRNRRK